MTTTGIDAQSTSGFLGRFEQFDGAIVLGLELDLELKMCSLLLRAYDSAKSPKPGSSPPDCWGLMRLDVAEWTEFRFAEADSASSAQLDDHLAIVWLDDRVYLIGDPLQCRDDCEVAWSLDQVRRSAWYIGGKQLRWTAA